MLRYTGRWTLNASSCSVHHQSMIPSCPQSAVRDARTVVVLAVGSLSKNSGTCQQICVAAGVHGRQQRGVRDVLGLGSLRFRRLVRLKAHGWLLRWAVCRIDGSGSG
jgi:hypothetical protein